MDKYLMQNIFTYCDLYDQIQLKKLNKYYYNLFEISNKKLCKCGCLCRAQSRCIDCNKYFSIHCINLSSYADNFIEHNCHKCWKRPQHKDRYIIGDWKECCLKYV